MKIFFVEFDEEKQKINISALRHYGNQVIGRIVTSSHEEYGMKYNVIFDKPFVFKKKAIFQGILRKPSKVNNNTKNIDNKVLEIGTEHKMIIKNINKKRTSVDLALHNDDSLDPVYREIKLKIET